MSDQKLSLHFNTTYDGKGANNLKNGVNSARGAIARLKDTMKNMGSTIGSSLKTVGSNLMNVKAGFDMLVGAAQKVGEVIKNAFDMSRLENNFKFLIGSTDEARRHMEMLYQLGRTPPFSTKEFASASKTLMLLTDNVLGGKESLEMLGDAADATGVPVETMAESVGLFYEMLRDGEPVAKVSKQLVKMGAITPEVASKMKRMQDEGKPLIEIWTTLTTSLDKFRGSMDNTAKSTGGKVEELKSRFEELQISIGQSFAKGFESQMDSVNESLDKVANNKSWNTLTERIGKFVGWYGGKLVGLGDSMANLVNMGIDKAMPTPKTGNGETIEDMIDTTPEVFDLPAKTPRQDLEEAQARLDEKHNKEQIEAMKKAAEKLSVDQKKIADNNRKAIEAENKAQAEAAKKASKGVYDEEMQRREDLKNTMLTQIRNRLEKIHEQQKKQKFYIDNSNGGHDGINGFGEGNRPVDENGRFIRPEHQQEADRQAERGRRNIDAQRLGQNRQDALRQQYDDLKKQIDKNIGGVEGLSDRDRQRYNRLKGFFDPEVDRLNKAADQITKQDLTAIGTKLDGIKTALESTLKLN